MRCLTLRRKAGKRYCTLSPYVCWGGFGNGQQACRGPSSGSFTARPFSLSSESGLRSSLFPALRTNLLCDLLCAFSSPNVRPKTSGCRLAVRFFCPVLRSAIYRNYSGNCTQGRSRGSSLTDPAPPLLCAHCAVIDRRGQAELELELIQSHMAQKPVLRGEVGCACVAREVSVERGGMGERGCARRLGGWVWV